VKASAKRLLNHLHDKLVLDWRRRAAATADVRVTIRDVLDADLPNDPYPPDVFDAKVQAVFDHIISAYGDDGGSVYDPDVSTPAPTAGVAVLTQPDLETITAGVVERIRVDAQFAALVAEQLGVPGGAALRAVAELIANDEDYAVEFKSTARWDLRENQPSKAMEDAVVKTVAGFLNTDGGTLLIGIGPDRQTVGLDHDYARVKPPNGDGFVNWLTTHLTNAIGHAAVMLTRARITTHDGHDICRLDVARSTRPVWAKTSKEESVFFVRMNNSTRQIPHSELFDYLRQRWPEAPTS
jgi:type I restriction enzyme R subunit